MPQRIRATHSGQLCSLGSRQIQVPFPHEPDAPEATERRIIFAKADLTALVYTRQYWSTSLTTKLSVCQTHLTSLLFIQWSPEDFCTWKIYSVVATQSKILNSTLFAHHSKIKQAKPWALPLNTAIQPSTRETDFIKKSTIFKETWTERYQSREHLIQMSIKWCRALEWVNVQRERFCVQKVQIRKTRSILFINQTVNENNRLFSRSDKKLWWLV